MMAGFGILGLLVMLFFWVGVIALGVWFVKALFSGGAPRSKSPTAVDGSPREVLDRRYARGEITREEYHLMKQDLAEDQ